MASRFLARAGQPAAYSLFPGINCNISTTPTHAGRHYFSSTSQASSSSAGNSNGYEAKSHYETLGIQPGASRMEVKAAYFNLSKRYHPDVRWVQHHSQEGREGQAKERDEKAEANATEKFHEVSKAYQVLSDDRQRRAYDRSLATSPTHRSRSYNAHTSHTPGSSHSSVHTYEMHTRRRRGATYAWETGPRGYTGRTQHPGHTHTHPHGASSASSSSSGSHYDPTSNPTSYPFSQSSSTAATSSGGRREERLTGPQMRAEEERAAHDRLMRESNVGRFFRALGIIVLVSWVGGFGMKHG